MKTKKVKLDIKELADKLNHGDSFTSAQFARMFKIKKPKSTNYSEIHSFQMKKVSAQSAINQKLAERGLYLKSKNYYNVFYIVDDDKVNKEISRYYNESASKTKLGVRLEVGVETARYKKTNRLKI